MLKSKSKNSLILAVAAIIGISIVIIFNITQEENNQQESYQVTSTEIQKILDGITETRIKNEQSDNPYVPKEPTWDNKAGPVVIDAHEYILGQKIFVNISGISENDKGRINVYKPVEDQEYMFLYSSIGFDGSQTRNNYYFTPSLSAVKGICHSDELLGEWIMKIEGTQYPDLTFTVIDELMPGFEKKYISIKDEGKC